jgi:hypothetical protein
MYSILIQTGVNTEKWAYYRLADGTVYIVDTLTDVATKVAELLNDHVLGDIKVIKNCTITNNITVEEVTV